MERGYRRKKYERELKERERKGKRVTARDEKEGMLTIVKCPEVTKSGTPMPAAEQIGGRNTVAMSLSFPLSIQVT